MPRANDDQALPQRGVVAARLADGCSQDCGRNLKARLCGDEEEWRCSVWIRRMAEASQQETHFGAIVEPSCAARTPWNPEHVEAASDLDAVDVGAHEHRVITRPTPTGNGIANLLGDPICLVRRRTESAEGHWRCIARHPLWGQLF